MQQWQITRWWEVLFSLGSRAWSTLGTLETRKGFAARRFTSLSPGEQCIILLMRALVSQPPLVLLEEGWSGMDEGMMSAGWRSLTEGGCVGETGNSCDFSLG